MHSLLAKWSIVLHGLTFPKAEGSILVGDIFYILIIIRPNYEAYISKYRLLYTSHRLDPRFARVVGAFGLSHIRVSHIHISHIRVSHIHIIYVGNYLPLGLRP